MSDSLKWNRDQYTDGLRGDVSLNKTIECLLYVIFIVIFIIFMYFLMVTDDEYTKSNRYSNCFVRLSETGSLNYEEMKEVCEKYLE